MCVYKTHSNRRSACRYFFAQLKAQWHGVMISRSFLQHYLRMIDIRYRLITSFLLVSLIPLFICGGIFYGESSEAIQRNKIISIGLICVIFVLLLSYVVCRSI